MRPGVLCIVEFGLWDPVALGSRVSKAQSLRAIGRSKPKRDLASRSPCQIFLALRFRMLAGEVRYRGMLVGGSFVFWVSWLWGSESWSNPYNVSRHLDPGGALCYLLCQGGKSGGWGLSGLACLNIPSVLSHCGLSQTRVLGLKVQGLQFPQTTQTPCTDRLKF